MTHRKYSRTRNALHKAMARHPGQRKAKHQRLEQSAKDQAGMTGDHLGAMALKEHRDEVHEQELKRLKLPINDRPKPAKGFMRKLFNRKTGS